MEEKEKTDSEFGKGLIYCLGLFLCHTDQNKNYYESSLEGNYSLWFNGAVDHLLEMIIPESLPIELKISLKDFQDKCLRWRFVNATGKDFEWSVETAKSFLLRLDKHFGIESCEATWT